MALISPWLIQFLFGNEFNGSVIPFLYMIPGVVLFALSKILANDFVGRGRPEINSFIAFFVAILNIILNILLIPSFGIKGAAITTSICYGLDAFIKVIYFSLHNKISFFKFVLVRQSDFKFYFNKIIDLINYNKK